MAIKITDLLRMITRRLIPLYQDPYVATNNAWALIEKLTGKDRIHLIALDEFNLTTEQEHTLELWLKKLTKEHMPLQYLLGTVPFLDLTLCIKPPVLIPRPETEEWCEYLIQELHKNALESLNILDLCTGSGCIGISLAQAFKKSTVIATDIHPDALQLACCNAKKNNITNIKFIQSDLYEQLKPLQTFDIIVANPPYISYEEWKNLQPEITRWEDPGALVAHDHGYELIKKIIMRAPQFLNKTPLAVGKLWIEIGSTQAARTQQMMLEFGFTRTKIVKDWFEKDRVVVGYL